jgi:GntR family transcriptional regulator, transcriptional repressor for pyruvate dehydrogenase complex
MELNMVSVSKRKLADSVIEEMKRMIRSGELKEGDKLPNQNEFATQLGVSRTSLREALNTLTRLGAIEQRPGLGTVIRSSVSTLLTDHLAPSLMSDQGAYTELIEARRFIEIGAAELAVKNATPEEIRELGKIVAEMTKAAEEERIADYTERDVAFHFLLAKMSHNRFILNLFVTIRGLMEQYMKESFQVLPWMLRRSLKFHQDIYEAIERTGDPAEAASQMKNHILNVQEVIEQYYRNMGPSSKTGETS